MSQPTHSFLHWKEHICLTCEPRSVEYRRGTPRLKNPYSNMGLWFSGALETINMDFCKIAELIVLVVLM